MKLYSLVLCMFLLTNRSRAEDIGSDSRTTAKKFQVALTQQSLHTVLLSIEDRLRNLDNIYSMQYSPGVEGRLEQYGRKLETVEAKISRLEAVMSNELDKISENISSRNFKDDLTRDHVLRRIDSIYERVDHRLIFAESKMDLTERKLENKLDTILSKLEKMADNIEIKDADMQGEIEEVLTYVEDIKSQTESIDEKLHNVTKALHGNVGVIQAEDPLHTEKNENITSTVRKDMKEHFEVLSNKIVDFHETSWQTYDRIERTLRSISLVSNLTRYEIQNGLRSLTVEVGRLSGSSILSDSSKDKSKLHEIDKKIDSNFESLMLAQNLFMENCYRLQKDEPQLETKISEVLDEMITTFNEKTAVEPKDIRRLEQVMKNHDQNFKKMSQNTVKTLNSLLNIARMYDKKIEDGLATLDFIKTAQSNSKSCQNETTIVFKQLEEALYLLRDLHNTTEKLNKSIQDDTKKFIVNNTLHQVVEKLEDISKNSNQETTLTSIKSSVENVQKTLDEIRHQTTTPKNTFPDEYSEKLKTFLDNYPKNNLSNCTNAKEISNITTIQEKIDSIFGPPPDPQKTGEGHWNETIEKIKANCFPEVDQRIFEYSSNIQCLRRYLNEETIRRMEKECLFGTEVTQDQILDCLKNVVIGDIFIVANVEIDDEVIAKIVSDCFGEVGENVDDMANFECFSNVSENIAQNVKNKCSLNRGNFTKQQLLICLEDLKQFSNVSNNTLVELGQINEEVIDKIKNCLSQDIADLNCLKAFLSGEFVDKIQNECIINGNFSKDDFITCVKDINSNIPMVNTSVSNEEDRNSDIQLVIENCFPEADQNVGNLANTQCLAWILDGETFLKVESQCSLNSEKLGKDEVVECLEKISGNNINDTSSNENINEETIEMIRSNCFPTFDVRQSEDPPNLECLTRIIGENASVEIVNECGITANNLEEKLINCLKNMTKINRDKTELSTANNIPEIISSTPIILSLTANNLNDENASVTPPIPTESTTENEYSPPQETIPDYADYTDTDYDN